MKGEEKERKEGKKEENKEIKKGKTKRREVEDIYWDA